MNKKLFELKGTETTLLSMDNKFTAAGAKNSIFEGNVYENLESDCWFYTFIENFDRNCGISEEIEIRVDFEILGNEHNNKIYAPDDGYFDYQIKIIDVEEN